jgi:hypothetical protein
MRGGLLFGWALCLLVVPACGGSEPAAAAPTESRVGSAEDAPGGQAPPEPDSNASEKGASDEAAGSGAKKAEVPTPEFKANGSVLEAINAVPQGTPRLNVEQEALAQPLNNVEIYEPCKPGNAHFKAKVAVWDGKAVGLDLTTTPKNQKFGNCVAEKIRAITWPDKVKSLNIVEYSF